MLLSIVTITYNNLNGLKRTGDSLLGLRKNPSVEWIVVDGGSKDGSVEYLNSISEVQYTSEPDRGIYDAMNKGFRRAQGVYIWFLNAGDIFNAVIQEQLMNALQEPNDVVYSDTNLMSDDMNILGLRSELSTRKLPDLLTKQSMLKGMVVGHQSFIAKKSICSEYDLTLKHVADYDWMIRVLERSAHNFRMHEPIACFDVSGHSSSHRVSSNIERFKVMTHHFGWWATCGQHLRIFWVNLNRLIRRKTAY